MLANMLEELLKLKVQIINEQQRALEYQQVIVDLRKENLSLKRELLIAQSNVPVEVPVDGQK